MSLRTALHLERGFVRHLLRFLRVRDSDERVARGFALGLAFNFFPTFGFGPLVSGFIARVFGGNAIAGIVGGVSLSFVWPLLFYFNIKVGGWFLPPPLPVEEVADVTERTVDHLVWGQTFAIGAIINACVAGFITYVVMKLLYGKARPALLARGREFLKSHQIRFRRRKKRP